MPELLKVVQYGDPVLQSSALSISNVDSSLAELLDDMVFTMRKSGGIGLAAPQIGRSIRCLVIESDRVVRKIVNPVILDSHGSVEMVEGCLSIPNLFVPMRRSKSIDIKYINENGTEVVALLSGWTARVVLHEIDHLDGKLLLDYFEPQKRQWLLESVGINA